MNKRAIFDEKSQPSDMTLVRRLFISALVVFVKHGVNATGFIVARGRLFIFGLVKRVVNYS